MENINIEEYKKAYLFPVSFFDSKNFLTNLKHQLIILKKGIDTDAREDIKGEINAIYQICYLNITDDKLKNEMHLMFFELFNYYAKKHESEETFENIISIIESKEIKENIFNKYPYKSKIIYSEILLNYYNLLNENSEGKFSTKKIDIIFKCKYYLWKIFSHHSEGKIKLSNLEYSYAISTLSITLAQLSRWFEPSYYLNIAETAYPKNFNIDYVRVLLLEAIKDKTCIDYSYLLILKIIECSEKSIKLSNYKEQIEQLNDYRSKFLNLLESNKIDINKLKEHKIKFESSKYKINSYQDFCNKNQLVLNEHSFFCSCRQIYNDELSIKTKHPHTQIEWTNKYEMYLNNICADFIIARTNFYDSLENHTQKNFNKVDKDKQTQISNSYLKNSFKTCYSILDQIGYSVLDALNIDTKKISKEPDSIIPQNLYFLNMWDCNLFSDNDYDENFYLISLLSIAKDLNKDKYAALDSFKEIRNAIEHSLLLVNEEKSQLPNSINRKEFEEKTKILLILTKSAILSFTYFIRIESKKHNKNNI